MKVCLIKNKIDNIFIFSIVKKMKRAKFSYYNTPMLVLHEYNLSQKSLYELYTLRREIISNTQYIVERLSNNKVELIEKIILTKSQGKELLDTIRDNSILCKKIRANQNYEIEDNFDLLKYYKNINKLETIFTFEKDSLLNINQIKNRAYLEWKYLFDILKEKLLQCKW